MRLTATLLFASALACQASENAAGRWEGTVAIPGRPVGLVVDLMMSGSEWKGSAIVPGYGVKGATLTDIAIKDSAVSFTIKGVLGGPKLVGRLDGDETMSGDFQLAGNTARFTLRKDGPPQVDLPRQSTAVRKELEGEWNGEMTYFDRPVRVRIKLANLPDGKASATMVLIGRKENNFPVDLVTQDAGNLELEITEPGLGYEGRYRKDSNEITGTFSQGPFETPLNLRRVNP